MVPAATWKIPTASRHRLIKGLSDEGLDAERYVIAVHRIGRDQRFTTARGYFSPPSTLSTAEAASDVVLLPRAVWI